MAIWGVRGKGKAGRVRQPGALAGEQWPLCPLYVVQDYCVEPPCGQLNPVNPHVYTTLGKLYQDFFELFDTDMFHMGGDEVNLNCWNTTKEIMDELRQRGETGTKEELLALWKSFQEQAAQKVKTALLECHICDFILTGV